MDEIGSVLVEYLSFRMNSCDSDISFLTWKRLQCCGPSSYLPNHHQQQPRRAGLHNSESSKDQIDQHKFDAGRKLVQAWRRDWQPEIAAIITLGSSFRLLAGFSTENTGTFKQSLLFRLWDYTALPCLNPSFFMSDYRKKIHRVLCISVMYLTKWAIPRAHIRLISWNPFCGI